MATKKTEEEKPQAEAPAERTEVETPTTATVTVDAVPQDLEKVTSTGTTTTDEVDVDIDPTSDIEEKPGHISLTPYRLADNIRYALAEYSYAEKLEAFAEIAKVISETKSRM